MAASERTFVMLKPDCIKRGLVGEVISRIERKGYRIANAKMMWLDENLLRVHYAHMTAKPFFPEILSYMMSGPVLAMIVEGENAVAGVRILMGATKFEEAAAGTIRGLRDEHRREQYPRSDCGNSRGGNQAFFG